MAKSQETYNKKEKEKQRLKKKQDKQARKEERKKNSSKGGDLESMMAYVDENGVITDTPPDPSKKRKFIASNIEIGVPKRGKEEPEDALKEGKVDFFNDEKGFGFIKENGTQEKYFVHISSVSEPIAENDSVIFELERGMKGMNAVRVKKGKLPEKVISAATEEGKEASGEEE